MGMLASTMMSLNSYGIADTIISDWDSELEANTHIGRDKASNLDEPPEVQTALKEGLVTKYTDWKKIDEEEVRGEAMGKERERCGMQKPKCTAANQHPKKKIERAL